MAMLDFLGNDVGGYAQGANINGTAGVGRTGMTYGDLLKAASQLSGGRSAALAGQIGNSYGTAPGVMPNLTGMNNAAMTNQQMLQGQEKKKDSLGAIAGLLMSFL